MTTEQETRQAVFEACGELLMAVEQAADAEGSQEQTLHSWMRADGMNVTVNIVPPNEVRVLIQVPVDEIMVRLANKDDDSVHD